MRPLPPVTILVEWENARGHEAAWIRRHLVALEAELLRCRDGAESPPRVLYLFDRLAVRAEDIRQAIAEAAPRLDEACTLEVVPTDGLTYYELKNFGARLATTGVIAMLDSDAAPEPGWLPAILAPLDDPAIMAVGGFTVLGYDDLVSRVMALTWIFNLGSERRKTLARHKIHANNCAFRTAFFRANPWPDLPAFKKQCGFWLRDIERRGIRWVRTADAMTIHAPQPGLRFLAWRAWTAGRDRDFQGAQDISPDRGRRLAFALRFWLKKSWRATRRIVARHREVELPSWQIPAALGLAYAYQAIVLVSQLWSAATRSYAPLRHLQPAEQRQQ